MALRCPLWARVTCYGVLVVLLGLCVTGHLTDVVPGQVGRTLARNSEGYLTALALCLYLDVGRGRLARLSHPVGWALLLGALLVVAGLVLRSLPLPSRIVTLNEAVIAVGILVPYLQPARPLGRRSSSPAPSSSASPALALPVAAVVFAVVTRSTSFGIDMAEVVGALVLVPVVVDLVDRELVDGGPVDRRRNLVAALGLALLILVVHVVTPRQPLDAVQDVTYYVQRTTEMFVVGCILLVYYATRGHVGSAGRTPGSRW